MSSPFLVATSLIFLSGPTSIGRMMPALALSTAPRNEVSSQGCTTIVGVGGTALAAAIKRSYFVGAPVCLASADMISLPIVPTGVKRPWPWDQKGQPLIPSLDLPLHRRQTMRRHA